MEKVIVNVEWADKNFSATFSDNVPGAVAFTADTFERLQAEAADTLRFHVEGYLDDPDEAANVPAWLAAGDYELEYRFADTAALLQSCSAYVSQAALSRASGINQHQLSHYANGLKKPRPQQRERIVEGLHRIGRELLTVV